MYLSNLGALPSWQQGDRVSAAELASVIDRLKRRGVAESQIVQIVSAWRSGALPWGQLPAGMAPFGVPVATSGPNILGGLFKGGMGMAIAAAALFFVLRRK